jgi:hypothetical protein
MVGLFILFTIFAVSIPVILEIRRTGGDNILKQAGMEVLESEPIKKLRQRIGLFPTTFGRIVAWIISLMLLLVCLWLFVSIVWFIF